MEFYSSDVLNVSSSTASPNTLNQSPTALSCSSSSSQPIQLDLVNYHHHPTGQSFSETDPISRAESDSTTLTPAVFQTCQGPLQHRSQSSDTLLSDSSPPQILGNSHDTNRGSQAHSGAQQCLLVDQQSHYHHHLNSTDPQAQLSHLSSQVFNNPSPALHHELEFQYEEIHSCPVTSDSIPRSTQLDLDLSNSLLNATQDPTTSAAATTITSHGNVMGLGSCYVDCSDLGNLPFQSSVDQALMGFESSFNFQEHRLSDHEVDEEHSNCTPTTELSPFSAHHQQQANQKHQIQFQPQRHTGWQSLRSNSSSFEDDQNQLPLSPTEMAAMRSSPPCITHPSDLYFNSSPLYRYNQAGSIPYAESVSLPSYTESPSMTSYSEQPLAIVLSQSSTVLRNGSTASDFSNGSSVNSTCVNPIHVNPLSQPVTPPDDIFAPMNDPFHQSWWGNQNAHSNVDPLAGSARASLDPCIQNSTDPEVGVRISSIFSQPMKLSTSSPSAPTSSRDPSSPHNILPQTNPPPSPSFHLSHKTRRTSHRSSLSNHQRNTTSKLSTRPFLIEPDYSQLPTKRSRGRRPPISPDLGLPIPDGHLSIGLQSVPGGQAFDPNLNPHAETVKYCELTKTGKPKKIFICQVKGCGKCFKRSEHLKRHVRSIHTNDKPYNCPWMACMKSFSRHDNLNQHLRVHRVEEGGEVLNGLHIGSDGILRSDLDESPVDPIIRGLRNVEVMDRFMIEE